MGDKSNKKLEKAIDAIKNKLDKMVETTSKNSNIVPFNVPITDNIRSELLIQKMKEIINGAPPNNSVDTNDKRSIIKNAILIEPEFKNYISEKFIDFDGMPIELILRIIQMYDKLSEKSPNKFSSRYEVYEKIRNEEIELKIFYSKKEKIDPPSITRNINNYRSTIIVTFPVFAFYKYKQTGKEIVDGIFFDNIVSLFLIIFETVLSNIIFMIYNIYPLYFSPYIEITEKKKYIFSGPLYKYFLNVQFGHLLLDEELTIRNNEYYFLLNCAINLYEILNNYKYERDNIMTSYENNFRSEIQTDSIEKKIDIISQNTGDKINKLFTDNQKCQYPKIFPRIYEWHLREYIAVLPEMIEYLRTKLTQIQPNKIANTTVYMNSQVRKIIQENTKIIKFVLPVQGEVSIDKLDGNYFIPFDYIVAQMKKISPQVKDNIHHLKTDKMILSLHQNSQLFALYFDFYVGSLEHTETTKDKGYMQFKYYATNLKNKANLTADVYFKMLYYIFFFIMMVNDPTSIYFKDIFKKYTVQFDLTLDISFTSPEIVDVKNFIIEMMESSDQFRYSVLSAKKSFQKTISYIDLTFAPISVINNIFHSHIQKIKGMTNMDDILQEFDICYHEMSSARIESFVFNIYQMANYFINFETERYKWYKSLEFAQNQDQTFWTNILLIDNEFWSAVLDSQFHQWDLGIYIFLLFFMPEKICTAIKDYKVTCNIPIFFTTIGDIESLDKNKIQKLIVGSLRQKYDSVNDL